MELLDQIAVRAHYFGPDASRALAVFCGWALLLFGSRVYRLAVVLPGALAGVWLAQQVTGGMDAKAQLAASAVLALGGGILAHLLERFAVSLAGALIFGGLADALGPQLMKSAFDWYVPAVAALAGLVAAPWVYERALPALTALLGSLALAWAYGREQDLIFIGLVAAAGFVFQLLLRRGGKGKDS